MKTNAKEYLKEFADSQPKWLKALIYDSIETNGNVTNERKNEIFKHLINGIELNIVEPNISNEATESEIYITELVHRSGVNALKEQQTIKFSKGITLLYGSNGAGKSSYFKVLNEIVGGNQKKEIFPNIYAKTTKPIEIELSFEEKGKQNKTINWNGSNRSLDLLNRCKVFDTSYLKGLLEIRKADSTLIQPLGLNLFVYLVNLVDDFKQAVSHKADKKRLEKPQLDLKDLRDEIKTSFQNHQASNNIKTQIEKLYAFSAEYAQKLAKLEKELLDLKQINIQDKINLKNNGKSELEDIKTHLEKTYRTISTSSIKAQEILKIYSENRAASNSAKEQFKILSKIPANNTEEWKEFIKAGEKYKLKLDDNEEICAYCRQSLQDDNSIQLVKSYSSFLKDESELKLNESIQAIDNFKQELNQVSTELNIKENIKLILNENKIEGSDKSLAQLIKIFISSIENNKLQLISIVNNKAPEEIKIELSKKNFINQRLSEIIERIQAEITEYTVSEENKREKIITLGKKINSLLENKSISNQKDKIEKWFSIDSAEKNLKNKANTINTTKISNLSKIAHDELLTEQLKNNFSKELKALDCKNLDIKIENTGIKKGISSTKLTLTKNKDIKDILSEGEQKAVVLALFIAETQIQKSNNPIILDDPVNSLDHKIAEEFAIRLLELDNQIILFNHNILFLEAFETSKDNHVCKAIDSDCNNLKGKHIRIYQVNSEGINSKGALSNYKGNKAENYIKKAKKLLNELDFDGSQIAILIRRAVECSIDEVVFNNQVPTKYSNGNSRINWRELKNLETDERIIKKLEKIHNRTSGGGVHGGVENSENPIEKDEFNQMIADIESILNQNNLLLNF